MKHLLIISCLLCAAIIINAEEPMMLIKPAVINEVKTALLKIHGDSQKFRIDRGVGQAASFWREEDGTVEEFKDFCLKSFIADEKILEVNFQRLERNFEILIGNFRKISLDLKKPVELDWGPILPLDMLFAQYTPYAHVSDDFFKNKLSFMIALNFPYYSLEEKIKFGHNRTSKEWAYARMGDMITARVPAEVNQKAAILTTNADTYISQYNICMDKLTDENRKTYFPKDMKLISHWGIRDELKARYKDSEGLKKQEMIFAVMNRIIKQEIPEMVIDNCEYDWNPIANKVFKDGKEIKFKPEPNTRYMHFLNTFKAARLIDPYNPKLPTLIKRRFEADREIPEKEVEELIIKILSSEQVKKTAKLIEKRLGRKLKPFDIWYVGFRAGGKIPEEELDKAVAKKFPTVETFQNALPEILIKLGFSREQADFLTPKILVEPSRGAGHAAGAAMKSDTAYLRSRIPGEGMNYKGYNIALHEFGHTVEQTFTLHRPDYYMLRGVPNTSFTEAFAYIFQNKDIALLGYKEDDENAAYLKALDSLWNTYEIGGVSLVDMKVWNWMYEHPNATPEELKVATIKIAKEVWNKYYADVFGSKDEVILSIYSHMIDSSLYLPDYTIGHVIEFQIFEYLKDKNLGSEMERMCATGSVIPELWLQKAVGSSISAEPMLKAVDEALKYIK